MKESPYSVKHDQQLMIDLWSPAIQEDPLAFVMYAFPWGKKGTPLADKKGPRKWQREELIQIRDHIRENKKRMAKGLPPLVYQSATVSGRGTGKSALVAWLILWMMSCVYGSTTIVTANTEAQLKDKTWAELGKWHTLLINSHWFEKMALSLKIQPWLEQEMKLQLKVDTGYYYAAAQLWSEEKPDSFAGAHNENGIMVVFDEASGIPKPIWTVTEGFFTEPVLHRYHFVFSNGRRATGMFYECFHRFREFWRRRYLDSRTVEGTDKIKLDQIVKQHGEDSDEARIEVRGMFPNQGSNQFISRLVVDQAVERELIADEWAPLMMGVDPARFGDDSTVIWFRRGRDARSIEPTILKGKDNMEVANICADLINRYNPDAICVDAGNGTGIIDRLKELGFKVHEVWFGSKSPEPEYADLRTHIWAQMRDWLGGGCIPQNQELYDDLTGPEYHFVGKGGDQTKLESKEKMKARGLASPDRGDALACTFAVKVARRDIHASRRAQVSRSRIAQGMDCNVLS